MYDPTVRRAAVRAALEDEATTTSNGGLLLFVSLGLFLVSQWGADPGSVALLVCVLFIHELGHLAGMRLLGFSDLRMFFVPFFGAAASGRKRGASAGEHAVVLLLGPLPGVVFGAALLWWQPEDPVLVELGAVALSLNAFNLLPLSPMDGGRLFEQLVFVHRPALETASRGLAALALGGLALLTWSWPLALLALFSASRIRRQAEIAREASALRSRAGVLPADPRALSDEHVDHLSAAAYAVAARLAYSPPVGEAYMSLDLRALWERAASPTASALTTRALLTVWALAWVVAVGGVAAGVHGSGP